MRKLLLNLMIMMLIVGCASVYVYDIDNQPFDAYPRHDTIPLSVELVFSEDLLNAFVESSSERISLGKILSENSERLARQLFSKVHTRKLNSQSGDEADILLTPRIVSVAHTRPMGAWGERRLTAILEWTVTDRKGTVIWVDTIQGEGVNSLGTVFTLRGHTVERVKLLTDDLFQKSFLSIASSVEIEQYVHKLAK